MPPRIMDASSKESTQSNPAIQWYPDTPIDKAANTSRLAIATEFTILLTKTDKGASFSCFRSNINDLVTVKILEFGNTEQL